MTPRTPRPASRSMGRPKKSAADRRKKYGFSMEAETMKAIKAEAKREKRNASSMAEILILEALAARGISGKK